MNIFDILNANYHQTDLILDSNDYQDISINHYVASILRFFIKSHNIKKCLEIGSLYGRSAMEIALALPKDGTVYTIEKDELKCQKSIENYRINDLSHKIIQLCGDATEIIKEIKESFDLIFIDANKSEYINYLNWACNHLNKNGLIIIDNVFLHKMHPSYQDPNSKTHKILKNFLEEILDKNKYNTLIVPYERDALAIINFIEPIESIL